MPETDPNATPEPATETPPAPPPTLAERAMTTEDARAAYVKARDKAAASATQSAEDAQAANVARDSLRRSITELVTAAKAEDT